MSDKKLPNPEDIQKEFEDFVKQRFGDSVQVFTGTMSSNESNHGAAPAADEDFRLDFDYSPRQLKEYLDGFIIKQDEAKRALAIAICDHYHHIKRVQQNPDENLDYAKQNILVLGPTGVGKTYMVRKIAELIGVPFIKADATRFSETGYVGANVDDLVRDLVTQAGGDIRKAQFGIVYLDEVDKIAASEAPHGRDVTGRGVQFGLLRLMEDADVDLKSGNDMQSQIRAMMEFQSGKVAKSIINTSNILFIVSGAFTGLDEIIRKRLHAKTMGFNAKRDAPVDLQNLLEQVTSQDLIDYGFEPEFIGRIPVRVACQPLLSEDLFVILRDAKGSIIRQYERSFAAYGIDVAFGEDAMQAIAEKAFVQKTGARGLLTVAESSLRNFKFELPGSHITSFIVDRNLIENPKSALKALLEQPNHMRLNSLILEVQKFEDTFYKQFGLRIQFTQRAAEGIALRATNESRSVMTICESLLESFEHGLKLIQQSSGREEFIFDCDILENPTGVLEDMIGSAFQQKSHRKIQRRIPGSDESSMLEPRH